MTNRRGHGEGTLYQRKRDGMWIAEMSLGDGRRKAFTGKTRQEAQKKLSAAKRDRDQGLPIVRETQTVGQWITAWLDMQQPRVESSTLASYRTLLRHASASLGESPRPERTPVRSQALHPR